jgi:hypothetical protein
LNKFVFILLLCCLLGPGFCFAQIIAISGKIADQKTGLPIPGASVRVAKAATSTNSTGEFNLVVNKPNVVISGITVSCIGYQTQHITYRGEASYPIKLQAATLQLHEVQILASAESIMQKAIRKIPQNYPGKDFNMQGILRILETSKDSAATYMYYKNDAVLNVYYPEYTKHADIEVSLIQNRFNRLKNPDHDIDSVKWVGGYMIPKRDFVHSGAGFVSLTGMKNFTYTNQGKGYVNNSRVYIINFYAGQLSGTLYIDTASYAFVSGSFTRYNIRQALFITIDKSISTVNYKKQNGKWYINNIQVNNYARHNHLNLNYAFNYKAIAVDTTKAEPITYHDRIQSLTENIKTNKPGTDTDWEKYKTLFGESERDSVIASVPVPKVDTLRSKKVNIGMWALTNVFGYLTNDNIRYGIQFTRVPIVLINYQPLLSKNIGSSAVYALNLSVQLRLYKGLFFQNDNANNYGIGGIKVKGTGYSLTYNFEFNKRHHPITLSPILGFDRIVLTNHDTEYFNQKSLAYGFSLAYEVKQRLSLFGGVKYIDPVNTYNAGLLLNNQNVYPSFGILYKLK